MVDRKKPTVDPSQYKPFQPDEDGIAPLAAYGGDYVFHVTSSMHGPEGVSNNNPAIAAWRVAQLHRKLERYRDEIVLTREYETEGELDVLLVAFGVTTRVARAVAREARSRGIKAGVLQLITLWPFPDQEVARLASRAKSVVVVEMNYSGQVAGEVERVLDSRDRVKRVNKYNGQIIMPQEVLAVLGDL